nr:hypothetical protein [Tanacetum cinerariifolium]
YALVVNPTIYVSCIKQFWALATINKVNDAVQLRALIDGKKVVVTEDVIRRDLWLDDADGVECFLNKEILAKLTRMGHEKPPHKLTFYKAFFSAQWKFSIHTLVQCVSAKRTAWNEFSCSMASVVIFLATGVQTPLFALMLVQPQPQAVEEEEVEIPTAPAPPSPTTVEEDEVNIPTAPAPPSPTNDPLPPPQDLTPTPHATPPASPLQEQPTTNFESSMSLLTTLMETYASLSQKVARLEQDKHTQALEILKLKKRVKKLEKKKKSKRMHPNRGKIKAIDADEDIALVDVETQEEVFTKDANLQGRITQEEVTTANKGVNVVEPTIFDDEEVTMTMAQTLIKIKVEKSKLLDEQMAQKLHDKEVLKATARDKQENNDMERAQVLQK